MQANMFKIQITTAGSNGPLSLIGKRIVPGEIPGKPSQEVWVDFLASVRREILFYQLVKDLTPSSSTHELKCQEVKSLFPKIYYSSGKEVR